MKIYQVSHIGMDDLTYNQYFTNKAKRNKEFTRLVNKKIQQEQDEDFDEENAEVKMVYPPSEFTCDISAKGIIAMLNRQFNQEQ